MRAVCVMGRKAQLDSSSQLQDPHSGALIAECDASDLHIVFRRQDDFYVTLDTQAPAAELSAVCAKSRSVAGVLHIDGLMSQRPQSAAFLLAKVEKGTPIVTRGI